MTTREFDGWLFDLYPRGAEMVLWFITPDGGSVRLLDTFPMEFFITGPPTTIIQCVEALERAGDAVPAGLTQREDIWSGKQQDVFALRVCDIQTWKQTLPRYAKRFPDVSWYNADIFPEQVYFYAHKAFPLARCRVYAEGSRLTRFDVLDDVWDREYEFPPLRIARLEGSGRLHRQRPQLRSLTLEYEGRSWVWDEADSLLSGFQHALDDMDPDVLLTRHGDGHLMPLIFSAAQTAGFPLRLDRDDPPGDRRIETEGRSYFSYGRILFQDPDCMLYGRWHLDGGNSFMVSNTGLHGLLESCRLGRLPVQRGSRRSIGTGITSAQLAEAWKRNVLVPWKKSEPEDWKTANVLLKTDRGGLVYAPACGFYENVVELDFASMYPSIMAHYNVSPETVNCRCCSNSTVPELGYTICKRSGLVSDALGPIVEKRQDLKALRHAAEQAGNEEGRTIFDQRQDALKWMLVCCFGYLGYRNARFGRIEAHEAVSAYARKLLTEAKEICINHGWKMIHANVDCVWIMKERWHCDEINELVEQINSRTHLTIALEGVYKWIGFLPSRRVSNRPVPTRYFGAFETGKLKYRGIEARRSDTPDFIRDVQLEFLNELATTGNASEYNRMVADLLPRMREYETMLWRQEVAIESLSLRTVLSRDPEEYQGNGPSALAARQAHRAGLKFHAGQPIHYVLADQNNADAQRRVRVLALLDADTTYDPAAYVRLLRRALNTLLWPAGEELDEKHATPPWHKSAPKRRQSIAPPDPQLSFLEVS